MEKEKKGSIWLKESALKLYLKSPHKLQYVLAKYGFKHVIKQKKISLKEIVKH